jgi:hypothetical protein
MSLSRLAVLFAYAAASTYCFSADPSAKPIDSDVRAITESVPLARWFNGISLTNAQVQTDEARDVVSKASRRKIGPGTLSGYTCLKLRTYRVKRRETFSEGESGSVGYSTCQWASNYQLRSTVETETLQGKPRE